MHASKPLSDNPFLLPGNPSPHSLETFPLLTWKSLLCVVARIPVHSGPWLAVNWPPPLLPNSPFPLPTVPLLECMPSYDDIAISASHSPIHLQNSGQMDGRGHLLVSGHWPDAPRNQFLGKLDQWAGHWPSNWPEFMMMIKLFITFSVHFLGYNLQYYYISHETVHFNIQTSIIFP